MRILICGSPRTGKTTLAKKLAVAAGCRLRSTDDLIGQYEWSELSAEVSRWFDELANVQFVIEGVRVGHSIRKWLKSHPTGKPCDEVVFLTKPWLPLTPGQASMGKAVETVFAEIEAELVRRGVRITRGIAPPRLEVVA